MHFPVAAPLSKLPANAPLWQRGALSFGTAAEAALFFNPVAKIGFSLAERTFFQIGKSALARHADRELLRSAGKSASIAAERKIVQNTEANSLKSFPPSS